MCRWHWTTSFTFTHGLSFAHVLHHDYNIHVFFDVHNPQCLKTTNFAGSVWSYKLLNDEVPRIGPQRLVRCPKQSVSQIQAEWMILFKVLCPCTLSPCPHHLYCFPGVNNVKTQNRLYSLMLYNDINWKIKGQTKWCLELDLCALSQLCLSP